MTILAVYALIIVYAASAKATDCTPGATMENTCMPNITCNAATGKWPIPPYNFEKKDCSRCDISNDPHFNNFMGDNYDVHGINKYAIAQFRLGINPEPYYVNAEFKACACCAGASCLKTVVYQLENKTKITYEQTGNPYSLYINTTLTVIPPGLPTQLSSDPVVIAWQWGNCLMVMANKGFTIQFCNNLWFMYIWMPKSLYGYTYGLCGHVDAIDKGKLVLRDYNSIPNTPANAKIFARSWETHPLGRKSQRIAEDSACTTNETMLAEFKPICAANIKADLSSELMKVAIDNCAFDQCVITDSNKRGDNDSYVDPDIWLNLAVKVAESQSKIIKSTTSLSDECEGLEGYRGKCFGTQNNLTDYSRCDSLNRNATGCADEEICCVDCSRQTELCNEKWETSAARNIYGTRNHCCRNERKVGEVRLGSGCTCCIHCKRNDLCKEKRGRCITDEDPKFNPTWCEKKGGYVIEEGCKGDGCSCCIWNRD